MTAAQPSARLNTYLGPKRQLLGNPAGRVAPAWKTGAVPTAPAMFAKGKHAEQGSKIFLSKLPLDVDEKEVEELFRKTVGPLKECFLVCNSQGRSKGMAVVAFTRPGDAFVAKNKYDGKFVDGRRPLKIEIIVDAMLSTNQTQQPASLLTRLGAPVPNTPTLFPLIPTSPTTTPFPYVSPFSPAAPPTIPPVSKPRKPHPQAQPPRRPAFPSIIVSPLATTRRRYKKGPKRIQKRVTKDQLDKEMEDYRAAADA